MGKITTKEEINLLYIQDPMYFRIILQERGVEVSDETREALCEFGPEFAYLYARHFEDKPHDLTRKIACGDASYAFQYAWWVDKCSHPVTAAAIKDHPYFKEHYKDIPERLK